jgi:hypothetical protein
MRVLILRNASQLRIGLVAFTDGGVVPGREGGPRASDPQVAPPALPNRAGARRVQPEPKKKPPPDTRYKGAAQSSTDYSSVVEDANGRLFDIMPSQASRAYPFLGTRDQQMNLKPSSRPASYISITRLGEAIFAPPRTSGDFPRRANGWPAVSPDGPGRAFDQSRTFCFKRCCSNSCNRACAFLMSAFFRKA